MKVISLDVVLSFRDTTLEVHKTKNLQKDTSADPPTDASWLLRGNLNINY